MLKFGGRELRKENSYILDLAQAVLKIVQASDDFILGLNPHRSFLNIGFGSEVTIRQLAEIISKILNFKGTINFNSSKPDGTMSKVLDSTRFRKSGWNPEIDLEKGLKDVIEEQLLVLKL